MHYTTEGTLTISNSRELRFSARNNHNLNLNPLLVTLSKSIQTLSTQQQAKGAADLTHLHRRTYKPHTHTPLTHRSKVESSTDYQKQLAPAERHESITW